MFKRQIGADDPALPCDVLQQGFCPYAIATVVNDDSCTLGSKLAHDRGTNAASGTRHKNI